MRKMIWALLICALLALVIGAVLMAGAGGTGKQLGTKLTAFGTGIMSGDTETVPAHVAVFRDPLDVAAAAVPDAGSKPMMSVAPVGDGWIAVGIRGLIVTGSSIKGPWHQAQVPVQSDLLAVQFLDSMRGWAVGHDGVVLHSEDGGKTWLKQFDGRMAAKSFVGFYKNGVDAGKKEWVSSLNQVELNYKSGPTLPFRDVLFLDEHRGFVVGAFGMIAVTSDGGKSWQPWLHQIDNPEFLHLNAIRAIAGEVYIAGERGQVYRLDKDSGRFVVSSTGYAGSFFGIVGNKDVLLAYGLRGTVFRSTDYGKTWAAVQTPLATTVVGGAYMERQHRFVLVTADGQIVTGDEMGNAFQAVKLGHPMAYTDVRSDSDESLVFSGQSGIRFEKLSSAELRK